MLKALGWETWVWSSRPESILLLWKWTSDFHSQGSQFPHIQKNRLEYMIYKIASSSKEECMIIMVKKERDHFQSFHIQISRNKRDTLTSNILKQLPGFPQCSILFSTLLRFFINEKECLSQRKIEKEENDQGSLFTKVQVTHQQSFGHLIKMYYLEKKITHKQNKTK